MFFIKDIWGFFCENKKKLSDQFLRVAAFPECGVEIYITEERGLPYFQVDVDERTEYEEASASKEDAESIYKRLLLLVVDELDGENDNNDLLTVGDKQWLNELKEAAKNMLEVFAGVSAEDAGFDDSEIEGLAANIAYMLYDTFGMSIRYPIVGEGEDGCPIVIQYPFE